MGVDHGYAMYNIANIYLNCGDFRGASTLPSHRQVPLRPWAIVPAMP